MEWNTYIAIDDYSHKGIEILSSIPSSRIIVRNASDRPSIQELSRLVKEYDILIIGAKEQMNAEVYSNVTKLKILGTLSIGVDHIDRKFFKDNKIDVINCPSSNVVSVAEHTFSLILALSKRLFEAHSASCSLKGRRGMTGLPYDIYGKKIGIIGAGKIARKVMEIAQAFGMQILCYTVHPEKHLELKNLGVEFVSLKTLFAKSNIITVHLPLTDLSNGLISNQLINTLNTKAIIINTSRSKIMDNIALAGALKNQSIFGAGIDLDIDDIETCKLYKHLNNVILTPHSAGVTNDSMLRMDTDLASYIIERIKTKYQKV
jgi:phosphoglycerate dehydrogenase-like enzyme